jgi:hypothetical protein
MKIPVKGLLFHSNYVCEEVRGYLEKGFVEIGEYRFDADKIKPFIIHKFGIISQPLYLFKSTTMVPLQFQEKTEVVKDYAVKYIEPINDIKFYEKDIFNPKMAKNIANLTFLEQLLKYVSEERKPIEWKKLLMVIGIGLVAIGLFIVFTNPSITNSIFKALNIPTKV